MDREILVGEDIKMNACLLDNIELELIYEKSKGAWTYHIEIPVTKGLKGKWESVKVKGPIAGYEFGVMNLMLLKEKNAIMSINSETRKSIQKSGGDIVKVTMILLEVENFNM